MPDSQSVKLVAALQKAGVSVQFLAAHGGGHNLRAYPGQPPASPEPKIFAAAAVKFFDDNLEAPASTAQNDSK